MRGDAYMFAGFALRSGRLVARFEAEADVRLVALEGVYFPQSDVEEMPPGPLHDELARRGRELLAAVRSIDVVHAHDAARRHSTPREHARGRR